VIRQPEPTATSAQELMDSMVPPEVKRRAGAYQAAIAVLSPRDAATAAAELTRRAIVRAMDATDDTKRSFVYRDRATADEATLGCIREYLAALKEIRT